MTAYTEGELRKLIGDQKVADRIIREAKERTIYYHDFPIIDEDIKYDSGEDEQAWEEIDRARNSDINAMAYNVFGYNASGISYTPDYTSHYQKKKYSSEANPNPNPNNNGNNGNGETSDDNNNEDRDDWKDPTRLYDKLTSKFKFVAFREEKNPDILWYDETKGVYVFGGEVKIKEELEKEWRSISNSDIFGKDDYAEPLTEHQRNEIVRMICWNHVAEREIFDADSNILNVKNGLLNMVTRELKSHTPDYLSLKQLPTIYNPNSPMPKRILRTLSQILDKESISILIRFMGYILMTKSSIHQKALMLVGNGANGKSVILSLLEMMVGKENCSHVKLQDLGRNRFMTAELFGKFLNTFADIPDVHIQDTSEFKAVVSGDTVHGERKYCNPFSFNNTAKLIFSTNKIPSSFDNSYGFYRRWIIIPCRRLFAGDNRDGHLLEKITTEEEMSGLLNLALLGLEKLTEEDGFGDKPLEEIKAEFHKDDEALKHFLREDCYTKNEQFEIERLEFINAYNDRCKRQNPPLAPMPEGRLEDELINKYGIYIRRKQKHYHKTVFFVGVTTKTAEDRRRLEEEHKHGQTTLSESLEA